MAKDAYDNSITKKMNGKLYIKESFLITTNTGMEFNSSIKTDMRDNFRMDVDMAKEG